MRNLTIKRHKSFVGSAVKDKVYIRDELAAELTIEGVPCRKLGVLKNGKESTFQIGEGAQQIFVIGDKLSKEYCNASVTVPEGTEDVFLSGKHQFVLGSNPFCFDGALTPEQTAQQKKKHRKGKIIFIASAIVGCIIGIFLNLDPAKEKTFENDGLQITLTDAFEETPQAGFHSFYQSDSVMVFALREEKELFGDITLETYGQLVLEANNHIGKEMNSADGYLWVAYTATPEDQAIYYLAACYESEDAFWVVNFATPATNEEKYADTFRQWAAAVSVD